jgi:hypothetical protein
MSERTVAKGIISKKSHRLFNENYSQFEDYIQLDVAVYQGCSGGPLLSFAGKMIGLICMRLTDGDTGMPIMSCSLAIPVNIISSKVDKFKQTFYEKKNGKLCVSCGWHNFDSNYCERCGSSLSKVTERSIGDNLQNKKSRVEIYDMCPICKSVPKKKAVYCHNCGASLIQKWGEK